MDKSVLLQRPEFLEFVEQVREQLEQMQPDDGVLQAILEREYADLEQQCRGWKNSLGDPSLEEFQRREIHDEWKLARERMDEIESQLQNLNGHSNSIDEYVRPELVADRLLKLRDTLNSDNAAALNVLLSQHIQGIYCDSEGNVTMRTTKLGLIPEIIHQCPMLVASQKATENDGEELNEGMIKPRRRTRRNISEIFTDDDEALLLNDFAVDPRRFAGLGPEWFTETVLHLPVDLSWREANARTIAEWRIENCATMEETAEHFERSEYIIREALKEAKEKHGINALGKNVSRSKRKCWARDHALEVAAFLKPEGITISHAAKHFGKAPQTIANANEIAMKMLGATRQG